LRLLPDNQDLGAWAGLAAGRDPFRRPAPDFRERGFMNKPRWNLYPLNPVFSNTPSKTFYGEQCPSVADLISFAGATDKAENASLTLVLDEYRLLSFALHGVPYVYACIGFNLRQ
jgi:hypothetical protein